MSAAATSLPTGLVPRFSLFIDGLKRMLGEGIGRRHDTLGSLAILLWNYLSVTPRRLTAPRGRFAAGKLPPRRARRPAAERPTDDHPRPERRPPGIPRGPVLLRAFRAPLSGQLQTLLDDPEMRALLAASPGAGRLLRPPWRKLSVDPLPEVPRLPRQPPRTKAAPPGDGTGADAHRIAVSRVAMAGPHPRGRPGAAPARLATAALAGLTAE